MVKIRISNIELNIEIFGLARQETVSIPFGRYKDKLYDFLVIDKDKIVLEGDDCVVLSRDNNYFRISVVSPREKLSKHFEDSNILVYGIEAVQPDKIAEALSVVLQQQ